MRYYLTLIFSGLTLALAAQNVTSTIDSSSAPELVLIQTLEVNASLSKVWDAYTTKSGWESCAAPLAEVDLKVNGTIKTNYNSEGVIGDETTNTLFIINYVPYKILTLQAELTDNFPEFMKADAVDFYNVIYFKDLGNKRTKIESYGIGYKNTPKYIELMNYFIPANEGLLEKLITVLEKE